MSDPRSDFERTQKAFLALFEELALADPERAAQEALVTERMMHDLMVQEGVLDA